jgi:predicted Zn-dependent protease
MRAAATLVTLLLSATASYGLSLISVSDEIAMGREAQQEVRKTVPVLADAEVTAYLGRLGKALAGRAGGPKYPYGFSIANKRDLNAFALPGGPIWIHRGILHAAANESQLAGVLAHEIAHVAQRHAANQITTQLVANGFLGLLGAMLGNDPGGARTAQAGARILAGSYMLKFSREDEREADRVGLEIMRRAGWDPRGMADFMDVLRREQGRDPGSVEVFLSTHPAPAERAAVLRRLAGSHRSGRRDSAAFRAAKGRVVRLPPPPKPAPLADRPLARRRLSHRVASGGRKPFESKWLSPQDGRLAAHGSREEARQGGPKTLPAPIRQVE